jgi:tRNA A37 threonylcarbamoyladenosine modification protein TsaB
VRSAIAIAQGWQLARGTPLVGVSSADVLASEAQRAGLRGPVSILIDAQRGEFYRADYQLGDDQAIETGSLRIGNVPTDGVVVGPDAGRFNGRLLYPGAAALISIGAQRTEYTPGELLEPIYLRAAAFVKAAPPRFS